MQNFTTKKAAEYLGMSVSWLEKRHPHGPRHIKLGRKVIYRKSDLDQWVEDCARKTQQVAA